MRSVPAGGPPNPASHILRRTHSIPDLDATRPRSELLQASNRTVGLRLTEYPVFLEAAGR